MAYIERNPVRARLVHRARRWPWTSATAHRGQPDRTGLLRQHLPKKMGFSELTDWQLASCVLELSNRPRKCLDSRTPAEVLHEHRVALTM